jgi:hypothetical protein
MHGDQKGNRIWIATEKELLGIVGSESVRVILHVDTFLCLVS